MPFLLEAHRDAGHHLCRHLRAQLSRRRPRRLVDDVQRNRPNDRVSRLLLRLLACQRRRRCNLLYRLLPLWCSRVSPIVDQRFDIVKTKMQADAHPNLTLTLTLALALALTLTLALTLCRST